MSSEDPTTVFTKRTRVVGRDPADVVEKAKPVIRDALERMLSRSEDFGPFLVIEDGSLQDCAGRFVQFCGSRERDLHFEAPSVDVYEEHDRNDLDVSVTRALELLASLCLSGVAFSEGIRLLESDTWESAEAREQDPIRRAAEEEGTIEQGLPS